MKDHNNVAAFVLAGGASRRMGRDKALLELDGVPMVVRMARLAEPHVASVTVVGPPERYASLGLGVVARPLAWYRAARGNCNGTECILGGLESYSQLRLTLSYGGVARMADCADARIAGASRRARITARA